MGNERQDNKRTDNKRKKPKGRKEDGARIKIRKENKLRYGLPGTDDQFVLSRVKGQL